MMAGDDGGYFQCAARVTEDFDNNAMVFTTGWNYLNKNFGPMWHVAEDTAAVIPCNLTRFDDTCLNSTATAEHCIAAALSMIDSCIYEYDSLDHRVNIDAFLGNLTGLRKSFFQKAYATRAALVHVCSRFHKGQDVYLLVPDTDSATERFAQMSSCGFLMPSQTDAKVIPPCCDETQISCSSSFTDVYVPWVQKHGTCLECHCPRACHNETECRRRGYAYAPAQVAWNQYDGSYALTLKSRRVNVTGPDDDGHYVHYAAIKNRSVVTWETEEGLQRIVNRLAVGTESVYDFDLVEETIFIDGVCEGDITSEFAGQL
jgi:hypothetical protein